MAGSCAASLVLLRAELVEVPYLNDSAVHEEMVRFALTLIRHGRFPPSSWFPYLNLGSPQYLHYQPLGAMITALFAWPLGVARAFTISTWLLVACWPICIYVAGRLFRLSEGAAAAAAALSPFLSSFTRVGYEQVSYLWSGYGVWSQLFAMWTLPLAWGCSYRAVEDERYVAPAAVMVAATVAFHFETGYLAVAGLLAAILVGPAGVLGRLRRGALVAISSFALCAWAVVPLVAQGKWAAVNQFLQHGPDANSYGARRVLSALVEGNLLDWHHAPVLTPLFFAGVLLAVVAALRPGARLTLEAAAARMVLLLFLVSLLLFFGRPTLARLLVFVPGASDLFLRRFVIGVQLAALLLAGAGAAWIGRLLVSAVPLTTFRPERRARGIGRLAASLLAGATLVPGWWFVSTQAARNAAFVVRQEAARPEEHALDRLLHLATVRGGGRVYAGDPSSWGNELKVGEVPVFKYLAAREVDEVGFTLRTASLMSDPEVVFDPDDLADYRAFGIRWLLLPVGTVPPVAARETAHRGPYALWRLDSGYVQVVYTDGHVAADSRDLASFAMSFLRSLPAHEAVYPTVGYDGGRPSPGTPPPGGNPTTPAGRVDSVRAVLDEGTLSTKVTLRHRAVVLLSVSYDPGWQVTVDGRRRPVEMVAPALVGVQVASGVHLVTFHYVGFPDYPELGLVALVGLLMLAVLEALRRRRPERAAAPLDGSVSDP